MPYEKNEETKLGHKYNDLNYYISISIYEVNESKTVTKIKSFTLKDYFSLYNIVKYSTIKKFQKFFY